MTTNGFSYTIKHETSFVFIIKKPNGFVKRGVKKTDRVILHCDMNNFYASVERLFDPRLRDVPIAVCGRESDRHGIVLAKSEEAKRSGVKTGDTVWQAKEKCPEIRIVEPHFERYVKYSRIAREMYSEYTDLVEPFGMDECWLDVSASRLAFGDGTTIAETLRQRMKKETGLTISVGLSFNKVFAKLGSDMKKPDALTVISREKMEEIVWPLPVGEMLGVGRRSAETLSLFGIHSLGDLATADDLFLKIKFGKVGERMKAWARGEDNSPVLPCDCEAPMKSVGHGTTPPKDLSTSEEVWLLILALMQDVGEKLRFHGKKANGVALECKDRNFSLRSMQKKLLSPTDCTMTLAREAFSLFQTKYLFREPIRSLSVRAIDLEKGGATQLSLFTEKKELRGETLDRVCDRLRSVYGKDIVKNASILSICVPDEKGYIPFSAPGLAQKK